MLMNLRDKAQGWIAWTILGFVVLAFLVGAGSAFDFFGDSVPVVAKVNGKKITEQELEHYYQQWLRQSGNVDGKAADPHIKKELLQNLIDQTILLQNVKKMGMDVSPSRIVSTMGTIPLFKGEDGTFSPDLYGRFLANANYSDLSFRNMLHDELLRAQLQQGIMQTGFLTATDLSELVTFILQKRNFRYTTIDRAPFSNGLVINDDEIKKYYQEHAKEFMTPELVSLEYVQLSLPQLLDTYHPEESELEKFYKDNIVLFTEPERIHVAHILVSLPANADKAAVEKANQRIEALQKQLKAGAAFEALAQQSSDDKESASKGGDLAYLQAGEMVPEFEKKAFSLEKAGQVSDPVKTEFGLHLIKLLDKQPEKVKPYGQVKQEVNVKMKQEWGQEQFASRADELGTLAYDHPDTLQTVADKLHLPIQKTDLFTKDHGPTDPVLGNPAVISAAFSDQVKDSKNNSDVIKLDDSNFIVLRIAKQVPAAPEPLEKVKDQIRSKLTYVKSEALTKAHAQDFIKKLKTANEPTRLQIASQYPWKEVMGATRTQKGLESSLLEAVFVMPDPNAKDPVLSAVPLPNGDYAITWLIGVENGDIKNISPEEKEAFQNSLIKHWDELEFALFVTHLFKQAKVEKKI
jgi:peptidyl-prolyl cis-trans isomerase D